MLIESYNIFLFFLGIISQTAIRLGYKILSKEYLNMLKMLLGVVVIFSLFIFFQGGPVKILIPTMFLFYLIGMTAFLFNKELTPKGNEELVLWHTLLYWWVYYNHDYGGFSGLVLFLGLIPTIVVAYSCVTKTTHPLVTITLSSWHVFTVLVFGMIGLSFFKLMELIQPAQFSIFHPWQMFIVGMTSMFVLPHIVRLQGLTMGLIAYFMSFVTTPLKKMLHYNDDQFLPIQVTPVRVVRAVVVIGVIAGLSYIVKLPVGIVVNVIMLMLPNIVWENN